MPAAARSVLCFCLITASGIAGCSKGNKPDAAASNAPATASVPQLPADASAVELYNAHRYAEARAKAEADLLRTKGRDKEVNQLTAGLSAYALGQTGLAEHHLDSLLGSSDPAIAGRAEAVLGQIAEKKGNHKYAADLFKRASAHLEGDDAAKAAVRAGTSLAEVGRVGPRRPAASVPKSNASQTLVPRTGTPASLYTIQVGAFSTRKAADIRAREVAGAASKAGLGQPRVVPDTINGKPGFAVQVGSFAVKQAAVSAKSRIGSGFVVAMN